ncbi:hypothetical protein AOQ84DRAFT_372614 [Glonium stellatum]|uniref:Uncharacterized protein n=1 Tax=Glonium stellatum TaxID=574774 RepID=A0A8E2F993_9PEZI|nr:hypothetical protein AOQ84DRAFT_372614 [Glonium stellatum]
MIRALLSLAILAQLLTITSAKHSKITIVPYVDLHCNGPPDGKSFDIKEGKCHDASLQSFNVKLHEHKSRNKWMNPNQNCTITVYETNGCVEGSKRPTIYTDIPSRMGIVCNSPLQDRAVHSMLFRCKPKRKVSGRRPAMTLEAMAVRQIVSLSTVLTTETATLVTNLPTPLTRTTLITRPYTTIVLRKDGKAQPTLGEPFTLLNWRKINSDRLDRRDVGKPTSVPKSMMHSSQLPNASPSLMSQSISARQTSLAMPAATIGPVGQPINWLNLLDGYESEGSDSDDTDPGEAQQRSGTLIIKNTLNPGKENQVTKEQSFTVEENGTNYSNDFSDFDDDDDKMRRGRSTVKRRGANEDVNEDAGHPIRVESYLRDIAEEAAPAAVVFGLALRKPKRC